MRLAFSWLILATLIVSGCSSLEPISSKPPQSAIVLPQPYKISLLLGGSYTLPSGEYRPLYEDKKRFYYQAPAKIIRKDIFSQMLDGGLYVQRGATEPTGWYYINPQNGMNVQTRFDKMPEFKLVP
jgi:hypothetical protein